MLKLKIPYPHEVIRMEETRDKIIVFVYLLDDTVQPFVTWRCDAEGNCYWGHYSASHAEALQDYKKRIAS